MNTRPILVVLLALAALAPAARASSLLPVSAVEERGEDGVTFVVELPPLAQAPVTTGGQTFTSLSAPGFGSTGAPGLPALPFRSFTIAVPPGREPVTRVSILAAESLDLVPAPAPQPTMDARDDDGLPTPGFRDSIDRAFYDGAASYPERLFEASPTSWLRQQRVFDLTLYPVRYDAAARRTTVARRLEVRVDFRPRLGLALAPERLPAPAFERGFEPVYRSTLVNYESARRFRAGPRAAAAAKAGAQGPRDFPELKLALRATGIYRLPFEQLARRGLPTGIAVDRLALAERRYVDGPDTTNFARDLLPIDVLDSNLNAVFDAGDAITFFGRSYRDRVRADPYLMRYTEENVLWLSWNGEVESPARLASRPGWLDDPVAPAAASFPDTFRFEEDRIYYNYAPRTPTSPVYAAHETVLSWYMTRHFPRQDLGDPYCVDSQCKAFYWPFTLADVDLNQSVVARTQMVSGQDGYIHLGTFLLGTGDPRFPGAEDTLVTRWGFSGHLAIGRWQSDPFPASLVTRSQSFFKFVGERKQDAGSPPITYAGAFFDWFELGYGHLYRARSDRLLCSSGAAAGPTELRIAGLSNPGGAAVWDVSDPLRPVRLSGTQAAGGELRFRDDLASFRRYAAFVPAAGELALDDDAIALDQPSALAATPADYVLVVPDRADIDGDGEPDDFPAEAERLADHREAHGLRVQIARLSDLADEFDGGLDRPLAIRNYLRYAFAHWSRPPQYLLLAGDGSDDYRDKVASGLDAVPTQLIFGPVFGDLDLELVACDTWYVAGLGEDDDEFDRHLDMAVGRLPAQSAAELRLMIDKTIAYEDFQPDERWRAKTLTISDDAWSSTISLNEEYRFRASELVFEAISDSINAMVESRSGIGDLIETRAMKLSTYTNQLPDSIHTQGAAEAHFDTTGSPLLYQLISEGNVIMNYQGHANRHLLAHERIFSSEFVPYDQRSFNNVGRPGIWFLYACHPNQFNEVNERVGTRVSGRERPVGELLLALPNAGLVAADASTGYEWLPGGIPGGRSFLYDLNTPQWEAFFLTPPEENPAGEPTGARWVLGDVVNVAKQIYNQRDAFKGPIFTYTLLGDPALRIDAIPPAFEVAAADSARAPGARLESFSAASDTLLVTAVIRDEVRIAIAEILERATDGQAIPVPDSLWSVESVDSLDTQGKRLRLTYRAPLRPLDYDIVIHARDASGRDLEFPLQVRVDAAFRADGDPLAGSDFISARAALETDLHAPVALASGDFRLLVDGVPLAGLRAEARDPLAKDWRLAADLDTGTGTHRLTLEIRRRAVRTVDFQVETSFALRKVAAYPNPFDRFTAFTYQLTDPADEVAIRIFSLTGRLVKEIAAPSAVGYSQVAWDGRDADGDQVANGVYIYRVVARAPERDVDFTGRLVRARE